MEISYHISKLFEILVKIMSSKKSEFYLMVKKYFENNFILQNFHSFNLAININLSLFILIFLLINLFLFLMDHMPFLKVFHKDFEIFQFIFKVLFQKYSKLLLYIHYK